MAEKEVPAWLKSFVKALHDRAAPLFRKVDKHIHTKNGVHAPEIDRRRQIHLRERNHLPKPWLDLLSAFRSREMIRELLFAHACDAPAGVNAAIGVLQRLPADVRSQDFNVPGVRKRK